METTKTRRLNGDAGSPAASDPNVWWHRCKVERDMVGTGHGEACSWCGRRQGDTPEIRDLTAHELEYISVVTDHGIAVLPR